MKQFNYTVTDELGIHARPAGLLIREASKFDSEITIECGGKKADAKRLFAVMGMGVKHGSTVTVTVSGKDEAEAADEIEKFLKANL